MRSHKSPKRVDLPALVAMRSVYRHQCRTVVWTNGCFDLLHAGHVQSLLAASTLGDIMIVGLNSDRSIRRLKGPSRPILPEAERAQVLAALECVDHVLLFDDLAPTRLLEQIQPDVHCKGADYAPPQGKPIPERAVVEAYGGRVAFLPLVSGLSTSHLIRRIRQLEECAAPAGG
jgi:D-beta-D-heptose 7-phosphate kinase/D-beta-D-heptose 1-phosphate adenosyltransferase